MRHIRGESQQFFATRLLMATRSVNFYERGKTPEPKQLMAFCAEAHRLKRNDLHQVFLRALNEELQPPPGFYLSMQFGPIESGPSAKTLRFGPNESGPPAKRTKKTKGAIKK